MLHKVTGKVRRISPQIVAIAIGPFELELSVPNSALCQDDANTSFHTYLHWNQENGPSLYGFSSELERQVFLLATSCTGIGPKVGLALLAELGPQEFLQAIHNNNDRALSKVNGIGPKKAEHIIVQLRHKVEKLLESNVNLETGTTGSLHWPALRTALESLGYSRLEISQTIKQLQTGDEIHHASFDRLMRGALALLSKPS